MESICAGLGPVLLNTDLDSGLVSALQIRRYKDLAKRMDYYIADAAC